MPGDPQQWGKDDLARQILLYLAGHPDATDTLDGIVQWWLLERRIKYQSLAVQETLAKLVEEGILFETQIDKSPPVYGLNTIIQNSGSVTTEILKKNDENS